MMENLKKFPIVKIRRGESQSASVSLPPERAITLFLNGERLITLLATPNKLKELSVGFLYSEGVLKNLKELKKVLVDMGKAVIWLETEKEILSKVLLQERILTSGCGQGVAFSNLSVSPLKSRLKITSADIIRLMKKVLLSGLYHKTGGVHTSALVDHQGIISYSEDIGRHNTIDKVLGECFLSQIKTEDKVLITTGRISSEMVLKAARTKVPMLVSHTAPTDLAVELAENLRITIAGYVRRDSMRIYSENSRLT